MPLKGLGNKLLEKWFSLSNLCALLGFGGFCPDGSSSGSSHMAQIPSVQHREKLRNGRWEQVWNKTQPLFPLCCWESLWCCFTSCHPSTKTFPAVLCLLLMDIWEELPFPLVPERGKALKNTLFQPSGCSWIFQKEIQAGDWALKWPVARGDGGQQQPAWHCWDCSRKRSFEDEI